MGNLLKGYSRVKQVGILVTRTRHPSSDAAHTQYSPPHPHHDMIQALTIRHLLISQQDIDSPKKLLIRTNNTLTALDIPTLSP